MDLPFMWYLVMSFAIAFYAILDGFDLGVGALHLFAKTDSQRRIFLNSIGPVWDGNEVWIVVVMGGLFAGFPNAYATVFSAFYTLFMALIAAFIFRAVSIEFRSKRESKIWRGVWDGVFSLSSILIAFLLGLVLGNMIEGVPLNAEQEFTGTCSLFFRPYSVLVGLTTAALLTMHGAIYLILKTEGQAQQTVRKWIHKTIFVFCFFYFLTTLFTLLYKPHMSSCLNHPQFCVFPILAFLSILSIPLLVRRNKEGWAFFCSSLSIVFLLSLFSLGTFPTIVQAFEPANSVTLYNAASSARTLKTLLWIVLIGLPLVFAYCGWVYRVFRGKVKIDVSSY